MLRYSISRNWRKKKVTLERDNARLFAQKQKYGICVHLHKYLLQIETFICNRFDVFYFKYYFLFLMYL